LKSLYPTLDRVTRESMDTGAQPKAGSGSTKANDPRSQQTHPEAFSRELLGFDIDDAFIREQHLIMERLQMHQTKGETTSNQVGSLCCMREREGLASLVAACSDRGEIHDTHAVGQSVLSDLKLIQEHQCRVLERIKKDAKEADKRDGSYGSDKSPAKSEKDLELESFHLDHHELTTVAERAGKNCQRKEPHLSTVYDETHLTESGLMAESQVKIDPGSSHGGPLQRDDGLVREKGKLKDARRDCTAQLFNGKTLKLKGAKHALKAISKGTAILVRCMGCQSTLQAPPSCSAVYCALCDHVTPMDLARALASSGAAPYDSNMAVALQRLELDYARANKASQP
jgi:hypothetical protein